MQTIQKNSREEIRVELGGFNGHPVFNARLWWKDDSGEFYPSKKGITFGAQHIPAFAAAVNAILETARDKGLVEEGK